VEMAEYDNTNTGILTRNTRQRNDKDPSHQGSVNIDGREFWLSAWVNEGKAGGKLEGQKYFSLKVKPKDEQAPAKPKEKATAAQGSKFDDDGDIPF
jgi:hypothetical protein